jgi:hypothetical protein
MYLKQGSIRDVWADSGGALLRKHPRSVGVASFWSERGGFWRFLEGVECPWGTEGLGGGVGGSGLLRSSERMPWNVDPQCQNAAQGLFFFFFLWRGRR